MSHGREYIALGRGCAIHIQILFGGLANRHHIGTALYHPAPMRPSNVGSIYVWSYLVPILVHGHVRRH